MAESMAADRASRLERRVIRLSIYDLDRTVTRLPTWTPFLFHAARARAPARLALAPLAGIAALAHGAKVMDRDRLKVVMHRLFLGQELRPDELEPLVDSFAVSTVARNIRPGARRQIERDRTEGRRIVIATAAHRFYAVAIAQRLGIEDVVATRARTTTREHIRPELDGENCYGPAKLRMITRWLGDQGIARRETHVRFYSDHATDAPTFEWADEAVAVNPHRRLRSLALARGWEIVDWGR